MKKLLLSLVLFSSLTVANAAPKYDPEQAMAFERTNRCTNCSLTYYQTEKRLDRRGSQLYSSDLTGATIGNSGEDWYRSDFSDIIAGENTKFYGNFINADFKNSKIFNVNFLGSIERANFEGASIINTIFSPQLKASGARFYNANLADSIFSHVILTKADFSKAVLSKVDFKNANLMGAIFYDATLSGADLRNANLCGAIITISQLEQAKSLAGATKPDCSGRFPY